jgi:hypothetical protein
MRRILALALVLLMSAQWGPSASAAETVKSQITGMPGGVKIEVRLKSKQTLRGTRGETTNSGFTLIDPANGNRQIAFDDVQSPRQLGKNSHATRNVVIVVAIALVVAVAVIAVHIKNCPLGCH